MELHPKTKDAYRLLHDGTLALARAEQQGIRIDLEYTKKAIKKLENELENLQTTFEESEFYIEWKKARNGKKPNINSNPQLAIYLYKTKRLKPAKYTTGGQGSTNEESLELLNIPELNDLLRIRQLKKVKDTYLTAFLREEVNGYIHPSFNLHLVITYRSSSDKPNFQNIPNRDEEARNIVRKALFARPGHMLFEADFSSLEVCIATCYHHDPTMIRYNRDKSTDMHGDMAKQIFGLKRYDPSISGHKTLRKATKNGFVFPEFYGSYYVNCAKNLAGTWGKLPETKWREGQGIELSPGYTMGDVLIDSDITSFKKFTAHIKEIEYDFWYNRFPVYQKWKDKWFAKYQRNGYVDLLTGFRCSGYMSKNDSINYPIQGAAFHCLLWSLIELDRVIQKEGLDTKIIGQIHDSIVLDVHPDELEYIAKIIHKITCVDLPQAWDWIIVPLEIEMEVTPVDGNWAELKEYKLP